MIEIDFYYTISGKWFLEFADSLSKASGVQLTVQNGTLDIPAELGSGRMVFHQLGKGISVLLSDCVFHKEIRLRRQAISATDCFQIAFNIGNDPILVEPDNGETISISRSLSSIMFSSHAREVTIYPTIGTEMRAVLLIFDWSWGVQHLFKQPAGATVKRVAQFQSHEPVQFVGHPDAMSIQLVEEMLTASQELSTSRQYLMGCVYQLAALFFNNLINEEADDRILSNETLHLSQFKEGVEKNLRKPIPSVEEAADRCFMSRTKFMITFKNLYGKSYLNYFSELRLEKAKELLEQNFEIDLVAAETGYNNVNYFSKIFKAQYGLSPAELQNASRA